jgi:hypothetical protein
VHPCLTRHVLSLPEPYRVQTSPESPTCHPSYPSVSVQSPESPMKTIYASRAIHSDSRPLRLETSHAHIALRLPEPHRHHPCSLHVTLAPVPSNNSHVSPLRAHFTPLVSATMTHNPLDLRLGLFTSSYALPDHQVPIGSPSLALCSIGQAVTLHSRLQASALYCLWSVLYVSLYVCPLSSASSSCMGLDSPFPLSWTL